ncbi:MAG: hypothetical protein ACQEWF_24375 [Bacillota bacterium]
MKKVDFTKLTSLLVVSFLLFWSFFPVVGYAFITPGKSYQPGKAITPGKSYQPGVPIGGGTFLVPGEVYQPGDTYTPGKTYNGGKTTNPGTPILVNFPLTNGTFIIPNVPPLPPNVIFGGESFAPGDSITGGTPSQPGDSDVDGNGKELEGGNVDADGNPIEAGNPEGNGNPIEGGDPNGSGNFDANSNPLKGGEAGSGGNPSSDGEASQGNGTTIGTNPSTGEVNQGETTPSVLNLFVGSTDSSRGIVGTIVGGLKDYKRYVLGFADKLAQAGATYYAGFKFNDLENGKYSVSGKNKLNNKISDWFYQRYKTYKFNGEDAHFGPYSRHIGESRFNDFLKSKSLGGGVGFWGNMKDATVKSLNESWNPASKSFWKFSNSLKLGGPVNAVLSSFNSVYDYGFGDDPLKRGKGLGSTDFAASLTTDVAIGVGSTAIGSVASSMAVGALAGSTVPVVGTAIGAVVGLGAGLTTTYLINGTATGRRLKEGTTKLIKKTYDGGINLAKKGAKAVSDGVSSTFKRIGGLFG